jgi:outer membrane lipoprotein-sorting protein
MKTSFCLVVLSVATAFSSPAFAGLSAHEIMSKNEQARKFQDLSSQSTLKTGGGRRKPSEKQFNWWRKLSSDGVHFDTLTRFNAPPENRGEAILFLEKPDSKNEILLYLPAFKKVRRVEVQQQSSSYMGSDFSYSDIAAIHVDDYEHTLLKEEPCPNPKENPGSCYVIQSVPANDTVRERTHYSKMVSWIRKDIFMGAQIEYYDLDGKLLKHLDISETRKDDPKHETYFSHALLMKNLQNEQSTSLHFDSVKVDQGIPDSTFSKTNLGETE